MSYLLLHYLPSKEDLSNTGLMDEVLPVGHVTLLTNVSIQGRRQDFSPRGGIENARGGKDFNVLNIPVTSQPPYLLR